MEISRNRHPCVTICFQQLRFSRPAVNCTFEFEIYACYPSDNLDLELPVDQDQRFRMILYDLKISNM